MPFRPAADVSVRIDPPPGIDDDEWRAALEEWWARDERVLLDSAGNAVGLILAVEISRSYSRPRPMGFVLRLSVDRALLDRLARISYVQEDIVVASQSSFAEVAPPVWRDPALEIPYGDTIWIGVDFGCGQS